MLKTFVRFSSSNPKLCVIGAGTAGSPIGSYFKRKGYDVTLFDGSDYTYYGPGQTLVGVGEMQPEEIKKSIFDYVPSKLNLVKQHVDYVQPDNNTIVLQNGDKHHYDVLVVSTGCIPNWDSVEGLKDALDDPEAHVGSIYDLDYAVKYRDLYHKHFQPDTLSNKMPPKGSQLIFTQPPMPYKCGGAPQKIMHYIASEFHTNGGLDKLESNIKYYSAAPVLFGIPYYSDKLKAIADGRGVETVFNSNLVRVDKASKTAFFKSGESEVAQEYDLLHAVPTHIAPAFIKDSGLADATGFMSVDKHTLQHTQYPNIFGIGDSSNLPISKTAAAIYSQRPVLQRNLENYVQGRELVAGYDGYTACPIVLGGNQLLMAEFKYDGVRSEGWMSSLIGNQNSIWYHLFKKKVFPYMFFNLGPQGHWYGKDGLFQPNLKCQLSK